MFMQSARTFLAAALLILAGGLSAGEAVAAGAPKSAYYDHRAHPDAWSGGARKVAIATPKGPHNVWIKRVGNNPRLKLLLLTGGPGLSHASPTRLPLPPRIGPEESHGRKGESFNSICHARPSVEQLDRASYPLLTTAFLATKE